MTSILTAAKLESCWAATDPIHERPPLRENATADVCVIGAGIAGMSVGYMLSLEGKRVIIVDDGRVGAGQTQVTTAHLSYVLDRRYYDLVRYHGTEHARRAVESHHHAIDAIENIAREEEIDCDFKRVPGYLFAHDADAIHDILDREYFTAHRLGIEGVVRLGQGPKPAEHLGPCLMFPNQGQFHPLKYLAGLAKAIERRGGRIYCGSHVTRIEGGDASKAFIDGDYVVHADHLVVATNTPVNDMFSIHTKQAPYITYVIAAKIPAGIIPTALYWDTDDPYHYVRLQPNGNGQELLIVGGEDHKTGQADDGEQRLARLEAWARERFPAIQEIEFFWSGQVMETTDGLAFIGRNPADYDNVYVATGDSGLGMTHGTIAGKIISDLIFNRPNPWAEVYAPDRTVFSSAGEFAKENLNVALQYVDWLTPGEVHSEQEIPPGQGAILREGMSKVAVYRDRSGNLTKVSAVCPHLKCIVHWNSTDSTWDCPCHGSRFTPQGKVINGPANTDLQKLNSKQQS